MVVHQTKDSGQLYSTVEELNKIGNLVEKYINGSENGHPSLPLKELYITKLETMNTRLCNAMSGDINEQTFELSNKLGELLSKLDGLEPNGNDRFLADLSDCRDDLRNIYMELKGTKPQRRSRLVDQMLYFCIGFSFVVLFLRCYVSYVYFY